MKSLGRHVLVEFYGCNHDKLNDLKFIEEAMTGAAEYAKATVVDDVFHRFNPHGVSGVVVIAESHLAIHTWPEYGYAAVDLFTCGEEINPWDAFFYLNKELEAETNKVWFDFGDALYQGGYITKNEVLEMLEMDTKNEEGFNELKNENNETENQETSQDDSEENESNSE